MLWQNESKCITAPEPVQGPPVVELVVWGFYGPPVLPSTQPSLSVINDYRRAEQSLNCSHWKKG